MPNGKPGDHPVTDILDYGLKVYGEPLDGLVKEVADLARTRAFDDLTQLLFDAQDSPAIRPELGRRLEQLRDQLEEAGR